jgi:hypothetical protein
MECTASAEAIAALGEQEEGEEAAKGTAAHEEIERCLSDPAQPLPVNPAHPAAYGVALVLDFVRQLPSGRLWVEQRVKLTDRIWGRCDIAHWDDAAAVLTIVDYKNGFVNIEAEKNEQLMIYAAASIFTHQLPAKWVRLVVVQPNSFLPVPRVKQWITSAEDLYAFAQRAAAVPDGEKRFVAGEQCTYCPLFGRCPASRDVLARLQVAMVNAPADVPTAQVPIFMALKKPIEDWFKALDGAATKKALAGTVPPGMKLVTSQKHMAWKSEAAARDAIVAKLGVKALDPPTPAQAKAKGMPEEDIAALAERPPGGPALAFESDRRPPFIRPSAAEMFKASVQEKAA